ncbi:uncharacterized protein APUU_11783S [Aspergillus puulaauensis]|uniref:Uncharacterized protein n=1 Tax=Aspergillus puulaauensis TaxID=1220207 RepID=A0A7R8AIR7_9EURO|nr:uncharacterized protein APUU_11783S [Aspergillus puulaauensis]BCS18955.1 hypothetical protein APUU_11783S [Aspergillus puulaauensis]
MSKSSALPPKYLIYNDGGGGSMRLKQASPPRSSIWHGPSQTLAMWSQSTSTIAIHLKPMLLNYTSKRFWSLKVGLAIKFGPWSFAILMIPWTHEETIIGFMKLARGIKFT